MLCNGRSAVSSQPRRNGCLSSKPSGHRRHSATSRVNPALQVKAAAVAVDAEPSTSSTGNAQASKQKLLDLIKFTGRGLGVRRYQRAVIEEAQLEVEALQGPALDYKLLEGKWKLLYTTASDVLPILEAEYAFSNPFGPNPIQVGNIYQRFSSTDVGVVENIIEFGTPFLLADRRGLTITVQASYDVRSGKRIALTFDEARVGGIRISPQLEALIAPAILPRSSLQQMLLLAIKEFQLRVPFRSAQQVANIALTQRNISAGYLLTYLDDTMLIGRATGLGGCFIFERELEEPTAN